MFQSILVPEVKTVPFIPTLLDRIFVYMILNTLAMVWLVLILTNIRLPHVTPSLPTQTQAAPSPVLVMMFTMVMVSAVFTTRMSAAQMNADGPMPSLTHALLNWHFS